MKIIWQTCKLIPNSKLNMPIHWIGMFFYNKFYSGWKQKMHNKIQIIDTNSDNIHDYGICGYKSMKRPGYLEKVKWLKDRIKEGLRIKTLYSEANGTQGMIEYI